MCARGRGAGGSQASPCAVAGQPRTPVEAGSGQARPTRPAGDGQASPRVPAWPSESYTRGGERGAT